jgi:hypothetical protein
MLVPMVVLIAGCLPQPPPAPVVGCNLVPTAAQAPRGFLSHLHRQGDMMTVSAPPAGVISAAEVMAILCGARGTPPFMFPNPATPIYGVISCVEAATCQDKFSGSLVQPGETLAVWVVGFPGTAGAATGDAYAILDAVSGEFIEGDGP